MPTHMTHKDYTAILVKYERNRVVYTPRADHKTVCSYHQSESQTNLKPSVNVVWVKGDAPLRQPARREPKPKGQKYYAGATGKYWVGRAMKSEPEQDFKPKLEQYVEPRAESKAYFNVNSVMKPTSDPKIALKAVQEIQQDDDKDELAAFDALESEAKEFTKDAEIHRILTAFKLDAYAVLDLQPGVPESDIKITYRKKSLLIHPDKTTNPSAPAAFDALKKAQTVLMDEKERGRLDECIADARMLLMRERKLNVDSPEIRTMDVEMKAAWRKKTVEVLIDNEKRRRNQLKAQMQEEGREQRKVDEEIETRKRRREHEVAWEETRETRIGSWRDFQGKAGGVASDAKDGGKKKKTKLKVLG